MLNYTHPSLIPRFQQIKNLIANVKENNSIFQAGGSTAAAADMNRKLTETQKDAEQLKKHLEESKEEAKRLTTETERLLQLVQMSQEEQAQKEKQIIELTQYVHTISTNLSKMAATWFATSRSTKNGLQKAILLR